MGRRRMAEDFGVGVFLQLVPSQRLSEKVGDQSHASARAAGFPHPRQRFVFIPDEP